MQPRAHVQIRWPNGTCALNTILNWTRTTVPRVDGLNFSFFFALTTEGTSASTAMNPSSISVVGEVSSPTALSRTEGMNWSISWVFHGAHGVGLPDAVG